ncbi:MAG TPA: RNA 2',3'-cyclic phosphodiesterase, partial [Bryobacteraceae bacterium]|nr:RNA 2',3'-cyclic phosphodiesterase [Bryobacteraceae bacterium]
MRLFTGIAIAGSVIARLEDTVRRLRPLARARWSPLENLHITTKFIGEWPEPGLGQLQEALGAIDPPGPIEIAVSGFGFYPNPRRPKILFANVNGGRALAELARRTGAALAPLGCAPEERAYSPHLTLARFGSEDTRALTREIESLGSPDFGSWQADRFHLYRSQTGGPHSVYAILA